MDAQAEEQADWLEECDEIESEIRAEFGADM